MTTDHDMNRRTFLRGLAAAGAVTATGLSGMAPAIAASKPVRIGLVAPKTGPLAIFYKEVPFVLEQIKKATGGQITIGGRKRPYEFIIKDSQSSPNRASQAAQDLIFNADIDLMTTFATPATVNPVSDQCEAFGMPCVATDCPLESYYYGRGAPKNGFDWTYLFFFSIDQQARASIHEWNQISTNKVLGALWPNDADGHTYARVYPDYLKKNGYTVVDPGRFNYPSSYSAQIAEFKAQGVEIVSGVLPPPEFYTFWNASAQQGFQPKIAWIGKATEFPPAVYPLGERAENLSIEIWWTPAAPFTSGLTGISSKDLATSYEKSSGDQWSMTLGIRHAVFEAAFHALQSAADLSRGAVRDALKNMQYDSIAGPIDFKQGGPFPNTAETPLAIGQWRKGSKYPLELQVVDNTEAPQVPVQSEPLPIQWG